MQACMVLRLEAEELTQYTDDLDADAKRELLGAMLHSVEAVLLFIRTVSATSRALLALLDVLLGWLQGACSCKCFGNLDRTGLVTKVPDVLVRTGVESAQALEQHLRSAMEVQDASARQLHEGVVRAALGIPSS